MLNTNVGHVIARRRARGWLDRDADTGVEQDYR